jgi:hypothetical protein
MIENLTTLVDLVWDYETRTLDEATPAASDGSYIDDIGYAVWTYSDRSVINPPPPPAPPFLAKGYALLGGGSFSGADEIRHLVGGDFSESTHWLHVVAGGYYFPPNPAATPYTPYLSNARTTADATWTQDEHNWPLNWDGTPSNYSYPDRYNLQARPNNTLFRHCLTEVRKLAQEWTTLQMFSVQDHVNSTYVRNLTTITGTHDISCISVWNSQDDGSRGCTAITPLHGIAANHYKLLPGDIVRFVAMDNQVVNRTIVYGEWIDTYDAWLVTFDSPLPTTIQPALIGPSDFADYHVSLMTEYGHYSSTGNPTEPPDFEQYPEEYKTTARVFYYPAFFRKQDNVLIYVEATQPKDQYEANSARWKVRYKQNWTQTVEFRDYTIGIQSGDSGGLCFSIINGQVVARGAAFGPSGGPALHYLLDVLQNKTGNACRVCDLTMFEKVS